MEFEACIAFLKERMKQPLPGQDAQFKLAPALRKRPDLSELLKTDSYKKSAVLVLLFPRNNLPHIVFIKRTAKGLHGGQISFPGGRIEDGETPLQSAIRETEEEVGIHAAQINVLGELTGLYIPPSNFFVYPFIAYTTSDLVFTINLLEAESHLELPLEKFLDNKNISNGEFHSPSKGTVSAPFFNIDGNQLWGATSMIMSEVAALF